ncbi:MAG: beta-galactosidase [Planctomycetota bacterium]
MRTPQQPPSHRRPTRLERFHFGAAYYPEHWPESHWARHADLMAEASVSLARMAEFAWDRMEPSLGELRFDWLEAAIEGLAERGIATMLCTPTAAPPRWITASDPRMLRVDEDGKPMLHGSRQHASSCHEGFRVHSRRITEAMAQRFADNPAVVGWQTDNEFHCHFSEDHSEAAQSAFRAWCRDRYDGDIDRLNEDWGAAFWAQTYGDFDELLTPRDARPTHLNPTHRLRYCEFLSDATAAFQAEQVAILRQANPDWWVTHNGTFDHLDYRGAVGEPLDFFSDDVYPMFAGPEPADRAAWQAYRCDAVRAWSGNFFVPEHQCGAGAQPPYMLDSPTPAEFRQMALRTVAHGADGLLMFRWRSCPFGAEQYWQGVLDHDGRPRARYAAFKALGSEFANLGPKLTGTTVQLDAAVAGSDMQVTDGFAACGMAFPSPNDHAKTLHRSLWEDGYAVGVVHPSDNLDGVALYVMPSWPMFDPAWVAPLEAWVRAGGVLVVTAMTATRHMNNQVITATPPGVLAELCGVRVGEFAKRELPEDRPSFAIGSATATAEAWFEALEPETEAGTETLATWTGGQWAGAGQAAVTVRNLGAGKVLYVGTLPGADVWSAIKPWCLEAAGLRPTLPEAPRGIEAVIRADASEQRRVLFVFNHTDTEASIQLPKGATRVDDGSKPEESITLGAGGSAIFTLPPIV